MQTEENIAGPHLDVYTQLYREINPNNLVEVEAQPAAHFLRSSGIDVHLLSRVWDVADYRHAGRLDRKGCFIAFKLVAAVQNGHPPLPAALNATLPPPTFASSTGRTSVQSEPLEWDISDEEQAKYSTIFQSLNPVNGRLSGEQVRPVLLNSKLPTYKLGKIWELSDIDHDGYLDRFEFYVAIHLVYKALQNEILPEKLPLSLVHPTKRHLMLGSGSRRQSLTSSPAPRPCKLWRTGSIVLAAFSHGSRTSSISSLNRSVIDSIHETGSPGGGVFKSVMDPRNVESVLSVQNTEPDFQRFDLDFDGYVDGADVKEPLMQSGLPQQFLAKIWSLVDLQHTGRLNVTQFTLLTQLVKECRHGVPLPDVLPPHLQQWLQTTQASKILIPSSPRIDELNEEIAQIQEERRKADQELMQLDADTVVKNAEIKNSELELLTLNSTVKQLRHQKGEANKRLADLDERIVRLEQSCEEQKERLAKEEERLQQTKQDIQGAQDNKDAEQQILDRIRGELREEDNKFAQVQGQLTQSRREMEQTVDELSMMERKTDTNKTETEKFEQLIEELKSQLEEADKLEDPSGDEAVLFKQFQQLNMDTNGSKPAQSNSFANNSLGQTRPIYDTVAVDPFKSDPFEDKSAAKSDFGSDPFGSSSAQQTSADPFGQDPFGAAQTTGNGQANGFANFANFAQFAS